MSNIRWGILSTAKIGTEKVIPAMQKAEYCDITAISSRDLQKAQQQATRLGIPKAYGSYDELLADPDIDAIYNPLPNHMHVQWSIKALEAGKHVLCEKPIGLSSDEGRKLVEAGKQHPDLKLMEAFMYRHHPQWLKAKQLVSEGAIGELRTINSVFSYFNDSSDNIRNSAMMGGGALMDIGCYPISLSRFIFDAQPKRVSSIMEYDPRFEVDRLTSAMMEFGNGTATFTCSTQLVPFQRVNIFGTEGGIEIEIPFNAPIDTRCKMWIWKGKDDRTQIDFDQCDQYGIQGDLFSQAILNDTPVPTPIQDAVDNMVVIEAIVESGRANNWVAID